MKIYTSYFANVKNLRKESIVPIGIALYPPRWYSGLNLRKVAPTESILRTKDLDEYTQRYKNEILSHLNVQSFVEELNRLTQGRDVALCCYEKPGDFCHRNLLAEKLRECGYEVEEFVSAEEKCQLSLDF